MSRTVIGTAIGMILGLVLVFAGFGAMLVVALFSIGGWAIAKVLGGEFDMGNLNSMAQQLRTRR
jgi:hypothetical protein